MNDNPTTPRRRTAETGIVPRVDAEPQTTREPRVPPHPPELDDSGGITGVMPIRAEGEDSAKHDDDTTSITASG
ncbi:MAG: hypothetical protein R3E39_09295 [Anaerolineae bacterium]